MYSTESIRKQEVKMSSSSNKIFRPWDSNSSSMCTSINQDSTAATIPEISREAYNSPTPPMSMRSIDEFMPGLGSFSYVQFHNQDFVHRLPADYMLSPNYPYEEYARVLSQDHQAKLLNARKQRPKKYKCPHCDVGFSNNGQLKGHIRIHTGERPYKCDEKNCGKTFTRNEELTRHKRIHSGLRPFPCAQCGKRFGRKDHLKKHSRTHMQPRAGMYALPVLFSPDVWASGAVSYPYVAPMPIMY